MPTPHFLPHSWEKSLEHEWGVGGELKINFREQGLSRVEKTEEKKSQK